MHITKIRMKNFMPFIDETIEFKEVDLRNGRKIYLIHGENMRGKTSISKAIVYVLYGERKKIRKYDFINEKLIKTGGTVEVEIHFIHNGDTYILERRMNIEKGITENSNIKESVNLYMNGTLFENQQSKSIEECINSILPYSASQFYFFDGAEIEKYADDDSQELIRNAIFTLLGLDICRITIEDLEKVKKDLNSSLYTEMEKNKKYDQLKSELKDSNEKLEELKSKCKDSEADLEESKKIKITLNMELLEHKEAKDLATKIKELEEKKGIISNEIKDYEAKEKALVDNYYLIISSNIILDSLGIIDNKIKDLVCKINPLIKIKGKKELIEELLTVDNCICGSKLTEKERNTLEKIVLNLDGQDEEYETLILEKNKWDSLKQKLEKAKLKSEENRSLIDTIVSDIVLRENRKKSIENKLKELKNKQAELGIIQIKELRKLIDNTELKIERLIQSIALLKLEISKEEKNIEDINRNLTSMSKSEKAMQNLIAQINIIDKLIKVFGLYSEKVMKLKKDAIQKTTNDIYKRVINLPQGSRSLIINEDYSFSLETSTGTKIPLRRESPGGKEAAAFSFIMGLNKYASHEAPIILDTPCGHLDDHHKESIANEIVAYNRSQVIMFVTSSDLKSGVGDILKNGVLQELQLHRNEFDRISTISERSGV